MTNEQQQPVVMVVDDDPSVLRTTGINLEAEGFKVVLCPNGRAAIEAFNKGIYTVILDISMPDMSGLEVFENLKEMNPIVPIILYTGLKEREQREGIRRRFRPHAYILKGSEPEELIDTVLGAVECYRETLNAIKLHTEVEVREKENICLREELGKKARFEDICTRDPKMKEVISQAQKASSVPYAVLITGESGTGKELLAKAIHYNSPRASKPFITLNCAAIPRELIESELFGHEKGSFTGATQRKVGLFEAANQGSIFLDEIGDLSTAAQSKILRVLQEKEVQRVGGTEPIKVDVRILAATNKNLADEIKKNNFREDLFYRLNSISIHLPPLRERRGDIPLLVERFLTKSSNEIKKRIQGVSAECMRILESYDWPGNIRELQNVIERLVTWTENDSIITEDFLPPELLSQIVRTSPHYKRTGKLYEVIHSLEKDIIANALKEAGGNKSKVAEILGISRPLLYKKIELYGLEEPVQTSS
ncbi:MAG TPA: sigma-54 interaction domain-containing protein [Candidatus Hypogeohydataceae bacterium YC41]